MKKIVASVLGLLCFNAVHAGPQATDMLDPIYETVNLPNSYYIKSEAKDRIDFANNKIPNLNVSVKFVNNKARQFYEIVADNMYQLTHEGNISGCQNVNDPAYKPFASYEIMCVKNQDSLHYLIFTQFEDDNNQPSDFTRVVSISSKTGDSVSSEDLAEMINTSNFKLGYFESFNIPQKSTLKHNGNIDYNRIDLEGMQKLSEVNENLWVSATNKSNSIPLISSDITNQGMKFFLKSPSTNEKFTVTYLLTTDKKNELANKIKATIPTVFHDCAPSTDTEGSDYTKLFTKCSEGEIEIDVKNIELRKYEFSTFEIITGSKELLDSFEENKSVISKIENYLFKQFYDNEILHQKDNVFAYMQNVEMNTQPEARLSYVIDNSTAKSIASLNMLKDNNASEQGTNAKNTNKIDESPIITTSNVNNPLSTDKILTYGGIAAIVLSLALLFIMRKKIKSKVVPYMQQKAAEKEEKKKTGVSPAADNSGELLAEIEAERIRREKENYKKKKEAEQIAKEIEERSKNETEEEALKRKEKLNQFVQQTNGIPAAIATTYQTEQDNSQNIKPDTTKSENQNTVEENKKTAEKPQQTENKQSSTAQKELKLAEIKPKETKELNKEKENKQENKQEKKEEDKVQKKWVTSSSELEEKARIEEEERKRAEEERIQREKEFNSVKLKGEDLLMKMKMKQKQSSESTKTDDTKKDEPIKKEIEDTKLSIQSPFSDDDFVKPTEQTIPEVKEEPVVEESPIEAKPLNEKTADKPEEEHHKSKNPFDALVTKGNPSKYNSLTKGITNNDQESKETEDGEIDLTTETLDSFSSEDSLFGSNNDTIRKYNESNEIQLDNDKSYESDLFKSQNIFTDDNMVQASSDTTQESLTDDFFTQTAISEDTTQITEQVDETPVDSVDNEPSPIEESREEESQKKKKSTKRVRRFNMGSLSISLREDN